MVQRDADEGEERHQLSLIVGLACSTVLVCRAQDKHNFTAPSPVFVPYTAPAPTLIVAGARRNQDDIPDVLQQPQVYGGTPVFHAAPVRYGAQVL